MSELRELEERLRRSGERLEDNEYHTEYIKGTAATLLWCADKLEQALDETEERRPNATVEPYDARDGDSYRVDQ